MGQALSIQDAVTATLTEMGIATDSLMHTVLLKDGYFAGHKFRFDGGYAVWLSDKDAVEFYGEDGKVLKSIVFLPDGKKAA
jgi:hypothetical protein